MGLIHEGIPDSKVNGANMGPIWGRQDPGGPHVGPKNLVIWGAITLNKFPGSKCRHFNIYPFQVVYIQYNVSAYDFIRACNVLTAQQFFKLILSYILTRSHKTLSSECLHQDMTLYGNALDDTTFDAIFGREGRIKDSEIVIPAVLYLDPSTYE